MKHLTLLILILAFCIGANAQKVKKIEYFFDTDPGVGAATAVPITTPLTNIVDFTFSVPVVSLSNGFHKFYVRCQDDSGRWCLATNRLFYKQNVPVVSNPKVTKLEYFVDNDPGVGNATKITVTATALLQDKTFTIDLSSLSTGFHKLFIRSYSDNGSWSTSTNQLFYKQDIVSVTTQKVSKLEYFMDTDPGVGLGTKITFTSAALWEDKTFSIDLTSLSDGFHRMYVRAAGDDGTWSISCNKLFYKQPITTATNAKIKAFEYFIDNDPGVGAGTKISIASPLATIEDKSVTIELSSVASGFHKLNIRALDNLGRWSTVSNSSFYMDVIPIVNNLIIKKVEYFIDTDPGQGNGTNMTFTQGANVDVQGNVDLTGLTKGFHKIFLRAKDNLGRWSVCTSRAFYMDVAPVSTIPNLVKGEYFIDTDPGYGLGNAITFTASNSIEDQAITIDLNSVTAGFHKLYVRYKDAWGNWSITSQDRFYKDASVPAVGTQIAEVSYYVGQGNDLAMNELIKVADFTPGLDVKDFVFPVDLGGKEVGNYYLYAFAKDFSGRYSTMAIDSFKICDNVARAKFSYVVASRTVTFTDESELAATYSWNFGDGNTSIEAEPVHTYFQNGKYNVCLTISNDCNESIYCDSIEVTYNAAPVSSSFWVYTNEDEDYTFSSSLFSYSDEEGNAMDHVRIKTTSGLLEGDSLVINDTLIPDGGIIKKSQLSKIIYKPAPNASGNRGNVTFQVNDGISYSDVYTIEFQVTGKNDMPSFTLTSDRIGLIQNCGLVTIEDWLTDLDDGDPEENQTLSGYITVIDGNSIFSVLPQLLQSDYSDITFTIADGVTGSSRCKVIMSDYSNAGNPYQNTVEKEFTISVSEFAAKLAVNKSEGCVGDEFTFTSASPTLGITFSWDFGVGATPKTFTGPVPVPVTYSSSGQKNIKLTITRGTTSDSKMININVLEKPTASFLTGSTLFPLYDTVLFENTSTGGNIFEWDFGDGSAKVTRYDTETVKHKYNAQDNDQFTALLTAKNGICTDVFSQKVKFIDAQPPVVTIREFPTTYNFNETKKVSVSAHDRVYELQGAKFYYKGVSGNQWGVKTVTATNDSVYEANIEETMGDAVGIEYYFDVFNKLGIKRKSETGFAYLSFDQGVEIPEVIFGSTVESYQILSIPLNLENNSVDSVFEELGSYDNTEWRMFHYNPNKLLEYSVDFTNLERGKGYWFIARSQTTLNTGAGTTNAEGDFENFKIPLRQGWTQIGNPYNFDIKWSDILAANSANADKIGNLRVYKNGSFVDDSVLRRFKGGFVFADETGIELTIPVKAVSSTKDGSMFVEKSVSYDEWEVDLALTIDKTQNNTMGFGMHPKANNSKDAYDAMTVPRFFNYLEGNFNHPDYFYPKFAKDIVKPGDSHIWDLDVETNLNGQLATLSWERNITSRLQQQVMLVDVSRHKVVDMKSTSQYIFKAGQNQGFKILYGDNQFLDSMLVFSQSSLGDCYPNPFEGKTTIPIYLAGENNGKSQIEMCIYSMDGRKIATVAQGEYKNGFHHISWEPDSNLLSGMYWCTLKNLTEGTTFTKPITLMK